MSDNSLLIVMLSFVSAYILSLLIIPALISLSHKYHIFDKPGPRKIHTRNISRLGGIGIFFSTLLAAFFAPTMLNLFIRERLFATYYSPVRLLVMSSATLIFILGLLDDFFDLKPKWKLAGQFVCSLIVCYSGVIIQKITIPFTGLDWEPGWLSWPITIIWIIGITNAVNLIDGMDGLAAGLSNITAFTYAIIFLLEGQYFEAIFSLTLVGTLTGYLFYNFPPSQIFMGDSGSLFLGFILALLPLLALPESGIAIYIPLTMLFIPIVDVFAAIIRRFRKRMHFYLADREHIHHKLIDMGLGTRGSLAWVFSLTLISSSIIVFYSRNPDSLPRTGLMIAGWLMILFLYLILREERRKKKLNDAESRLRKEISEDSN